MAPMVTAAGADVTSALKAGGRAVSPRQYTRSLLVVAEVALTFVLVFGASLLVRSLIAAQHADPGVTAAQVLAVELRLPASYRGNDAVAAFYARFGEAVRAIPGVTAISSVRCPPGAGDCGDWFYSVVGRPAPARNEVPIAFTNAAEPGYFKTMGVAVRQGREFSAEDRAGGQPAPHASPPQRARQPRGGRAVGGPGPAGDAGDRGPAGGPRSGTGAADPEVHRTLRPSLGDSWGSPTGGVVRGRSRDPHRYHAARHAARRATWQDRDPGSRTSLAFPLRTSSGGPGAPSATRLGVAA